jgi:hypothetical protein
VRTFAAELNTRCGVATGQCIEQYGRTEPYLPVLDGLWLAQEILIGEVTMAKRPVLVCAAITGDQHNAPRPIKNHQRVCGALLK